MKNLKILLFITAVAFGCADENNNPELEYFSEELHFRAPVTWKLIGVQDMGGIWRSPNLSEVHTLLYLKNLQVQYDGENGKCLGTYSVEENRLVLKDLPCAVTSSHMWYSHSIISNFDSVVVTAPRLNPTAFQMPYYKYRVQTIL